MPKIPNFIVAGAPKTGTTALCQYLGEHPNAFVCNPKEPFYWCSDFKKSKPFHNMTSLENYLALFEDATEEHSAIGEGSTTYMQSREALRNIIEFNPDIRVIAMLRNPLDVAYAMHGELVRHFMEDERDFRKAWELQESRADGKNLPSVDRMDHQLQYRDVASFFPQVKRLWDFIPESQRLLIIFDDFAADTKGAYEQVVDFLGLPQTGRTEFPKVHAAKVFRNQFVGRMYHDPPAFLEPVVAQFRKWFTGGQKGWLKSSLSKLASREKKRDPLGDEFRGLLKDTFREDIQQVSDLIQRDLTSWVA